MSTTSSSVSSVTLDTLIGFCAAHPVPDTDAPRILTRLNSGPSAIIDWRDRGVVAVILDTIIGAKGTVPFEIVGAAGGKMADILAADLLAEIDGAVKEANSHVSHAEAIRKFKILPVDFTEETGEMTPTLKVKRKVVAEKFADQIDAIYRKD